MKGCHLLELDYLYIEDSYKSADECERSFSFLKNSKILDKISGLTVGKCEDFNSKNSNKTYNSLLLRFINRKILILMNYDCSHCQSMNTPVIGSKIRLDTITKTEYLISVSHSD